MWLDPRMTQYELWETGILIPGITSSFNPKTVVRSNKTNHASPVRLRLEDVNRS